MTSTAVKLKLLLRVLLIPAALFMLCVLVHLGQTQEKILSFLHGWGSLFSLALFVVLLHATVEVKVAVEDYVKNLTFRSFLLKGLYVKALVVFVLIVISLVKV